MKNPLLCIIFILCAAEGARNKRSLVYPKGTGVVQAIMGAGFPVDLQDETVIIGIVIKAHYNLPQNASDYTNPNVVYARRRRSIAAPSRWDVYRILAQYADLYGYGNKGCILRTICELSDTPIDKSTGLIEEILHTLFTPSTTEEIIGEHGDNEYYAAERIGRTNRGNCPRFFNDCDGSFVDMFTTFLK